MKLVVPLSRPKCGECLATDPLLRLGRMRVLRAPHDGNVPTTKWRRPDIDMPAQRRTTNCWEYGHAAACLERALIASRSW